MRELARRPLAWLPIALSLVALLEVALWVARFGVTAPGNGDEGFAARIFQALIALASVLILAFGIRWLPRAPRAAAVVLALQLVAAAIPVITVAVLESGVRPG